MIKRLYYEHKHYTTQDYEEEIVCEDGVVVSSSAAAMEAVGGHSGRPIGLPYVRISESNQGQDSERYSEKNDVNLGESSGHQECSLELDLEDLNTSAAGVARIPQRHQGPQNHFHFARCQIQKMERVFKKSQYPDLSARQELARALNVPEDKLNLWFANQRAKERKKETLVRIENTPPDEYIIILRDIEEDSS